MRVCSFVGQLIKVFASNQDKGLLHQCFDRPVSNIGQHLVFPSHLHYLYLLSVVGTDRLKLLISQEEHQYLGTTWPHWDTSCEKRASRKKKRPLSLDGIGIAYGKGIVPKVCCCLEIVCFRSAACNGSSFHGSPSMTDFKGLDPRSRVNLTLRSGGANFLWCPWLFIR